MHKIKEAALRRTFAMLLIGLTGASAPVTAATGTFSPGGGWTATGSIGITKGTSSISCTVTINGNFSTANVTVPPSVTIGSITSTDSTPGSVLCLSSTSVNLPWAIQTTNVVYNGSVPAVATSIDLKFINVDMRNSTYGDCVGSLSGTYDLVSGKIVVPAASMAGTYPSLPCHFHGPGSSDNNDPAIFTLSPSQTFNVTAP